MIHTGDCLEVMRTMPADSVDAVVTDPPYGLEFMGRSWDTFGSGEAQSRAVATFTEDGMGKGFKALPSYLGGLNPRCKTCRKSQRGGSPCQCEKPDFTNEILPRVVAFQAWCQSWGTEALRVTKPGGYLLAFGGTRTHHRLVCGLEDAGWIIRDELTWVYASGFPKGKANLKPAHEPIVLARKPGPLRPLGIDAARIGTPENKRAAGTRTYQVGKAGQPVDESKSSMLQPAPHDGLGRWPSNLLLSDPALFDEPNPEVVGSGATTTSGDGVRRVHGRSDWEGGDLGPDAAEWDGDSGGYSRFFIVPKSSRADREPVVRGTLEAKRMGLGALAAEQEGEYIDFFHPPPEGIGRWLREQREAAGLQQKQVAAHFPSRTGGLTGCVANWELEFNRPTPDQWRTLREVIGFDDRYDERMTAVQSVEHAKRPADLPMRENAHPTVKPVDLMRHLIRLVTPSGGTVLDPFLGSGSTAIAAELEGFPWIGIEKEPEYVAIAEARLNGTQRGLGLDVGAPTRKQPKPMPGYYPDPLDRKSPKGWSGRWKGDPTAEEPVA